MEIVKDKPSKPVGVIRYTPLGEEFSKIYSDGSLKFNDFEYPPLVIPIDSISKDLKRAMIRINELIAVIVHNKRKLPLTRSEAIDGGVDKSTLKKLERFGVLKILSMKLLKENKSTASTHQSVRIVYFTPQGRSFMKELRGD